MTIHKETEIKHPQYITVLDNGVTLFVYDGYGEGSDSRTYYPVLKETAEGECETLGWRV